MTKKYFEGYDSNNPRKKFGFIAPVRASGTLVYQSIKKKVHVDHFVLVYTGVDLTPETVFQKMVDSGFVFESVDRTLGDIDKLLGEARKSKLGHVYKVKPDVEFDFECLGKIKTT
jgi:hypothetical protein